MNWLKSISGRYHFVILAIVAALLSVAIKFTFGLAFTDLVPHLLADASIIFLAAELVERTLLSNFNSAADARLDMLGGKLSDKVEDVLCQSLDDAKYAAHYNVHFRPPRRSERNAQISYKEIAAAIQHADWIKLLCTSGRDIFASEPMVVNALQKRAMAPPLAITVLSSEPASQDGQRGSYASVRGRLEEPGYWNSISEDVGVALTAFQRLFIISRKNPQLNFRWLYYDFVPQGWFLLTDKVGFAEFYHFGLNVRQRGIPSSCIGGRVPLVAFSPKAGLYDALDEYLSYLAGDLFLDNDLAQHHRVHYFKVQEIYNSLKPLA